MRFKLPVIKPLLFIFGSSFICHSAVANAAGPAERGQYLVNQVAMCVECHTPRDQSGKLLKNSYLRGAAIPVKAPSFPNMKWAAKAPNIVGLPGYSEEQGIRLLTEGINRDGKTPDPPMPQFRLTRDDAAAIVAYLKSLK
jgi:mono/diheme cytochrome c family protein